MAHELNKFSFQAKELLQATAKTRVKYLTKKSNCQNFKLILSSLKQICKTENHYDNHSEESPFANTKQLFKSNEAKIGNSSTVLDT